MVLQSTAFHARARLRALVAPADYGVASLEELDENYELKSLLVSVGGNNRADGVVTQSSRNGEEHIYTELYFNLANPTPGDPGEL